VRILIAEDDPISQKMLQAILKKWGHEVVVTSNGAEALAQLQTDDAPKLAILDWMMPEMDGPEVCKNIRQTDGGEFLYIILLTAKGRKEDLVIGLEAGADDYVIKPFDHGELRVRVRCGQRIIELQDEIIAARDALHIQATHDSLTGLLNRAAIYEVLEREKSLAKRKKLPMTVIMADLDHFKSVNDTYGHAAGDAVLREITTRITSQMRAYDVAGRYGGEEFLILLPDTSKENAIIQTNRLREFVASKPVVIDDKGTALNVTASFGVATIDQPADMNLDDLVKAADEALYQAKENGRNCVEAISLATIKT
jgi:diguanylate cyclase (GGDEF)-like protein